MTLTTQVETPVDLIKTSLVRMGGLISGFASITGKRHSINEDNGMDARYLNGI